MQPHAEAAREFHNGLFCSSQLLSSQWPHRTRPRKISRLFPRPTMARMTKFCQKKMFSFVFDSGGINVMDNSNQGSLANSQWPHRARPQKISRLFPRLTIARMTKFFLFFLSFFREGNARTYLQLPLRQFLGTAKAYFVCHIGPIFQISLIFAFIGCPLSVAGSNRWS
jgi:hypothetical protein